MKPVKYEAPNSLENMAFKHLGKKKTYASCSAQSQFKGLIDDGHIGVA